MSRHESSERVELTITTGPPDVLPKDFAASDDAPASASNLTVPVDALHRATAGLAAREQSGPNALERAVQAAQKALGTYDSSDLAKKSVTEILGVAKKVVAALEVLQPLHPVINVAVSAFKGIISLEIKRQENNKRIGGLLIEASLMMGDLLRLNGLADQDIKTPAGDTFPSRLRITLEDMATAVTECGNAIDTYCKTGGFVKYFKSSDWEEKFISFSSTFRRLQRATQQVLAIRMTFTTEKTAAGVERLEKKVDDLLRTKTDQEKKLTDAIKKNNGPENCLGSPAIMKELLQLTDDSRVAVARDGKQFDFATLVYNLRRPLDSVLQENLDGFRRLLEEHKKDLTTAIEDLPPRILEAFSVGAAYKRLKDLHVSYVWEHERWPSSVGTAQLVASLHDYFSDRFSQHEDPSVPPTPAFESQPVKPGDRVTRLPDIDMADRWCLAYLEIFYLPAIREALDDDANGLVNIREINTLTMSRNLPGDWSILKRLAYAASGWHIEMLKYHDMIHQLLNSMLLLAADVLPENRRLVCRSMNNISSNYVSAITRGLSELPSFDATVPELYELVKERMEHHQEVLRQQLDTFKYELPSVDFLPDKFGKSRVEYYLLPLFYLVLLRHAQVISLAKTVVLDRRELYTGEQSLLNIVELASRRVSMLKESFLQQGLVPDAKFETFARGLYKCIRNPERVSDDTEAAEESLGEHEDLPTGVGVESILRFPPSTPSNPSSSEQAVLAPRQKFQALVSRVILQQQAKKSWGYDALRPKWMQECVELAPLFILNTMQWLEDAPPNFTPQQLSRMALLHDILTPQDLTICYERADLVFRGWNVFAFSCDGCHRNPVRSQVYRCVVCDNYDLCLSCVDLPTSQHDFPVDSHTEEHSMIVHRVEPPVQRVHRLVRHARENLQSYVIPQNAQNESNEVIVALESVEQRGASASGHDWGLLCTECSARLVGPFYCCLVCLDTTGTGVQCRLCRTCWTRESLTAVPGHDQARHAMALVRSPNALSISGQATGAGEVEEQPTVTIEILHKTVAQLSERLEGLEAQMATVVGLLRQAAEGSQAPFVPSAEPL